MIDHSASDSSMGVGESLQEPRRLPGLSADVRILDCLRDDGFTRLLRVESECHDGQRRLIKLRDGGPSSVRAVCLHTEHEILVRHRLSCALPFEELAGSGEEAALLFRDPGGTCLDRVEQLPLAQWLETAVAMVEALREVHDAGLLHRDIRPDSFLLSPERLYITDFSSAVLRRRDHRELQVLDSNVERLRTIAPELTGRLNRPVDIRADYYSLGVVLYQRLTGQPPFVANEPHELIYQHLALAPAAPRAARCTHPENALPHPAAAAGEGSGAPLSGRGDASRSPAVGTSGGAR